MTIVGFEERRLAPALAGDAEARRRFLQTARSLKRLQHPHIAAVSAIDERSDPPSYRVERATGESLARLATTAGGLPLAEVIALLQPLCAALDALHDEGLRCRWLARDALLEPSGRVLLGVQHIAPPCPGEAASTEDDIRALGALACTLLTGDAPPRDDASLRSALQAQPSPPPAAALAAMLMALADDPAARPPTASAFLALFDGSWPLGATAGALARPPCPATESAPALPADAVQVLPDEPVATIPDQPRASAAPSGTPQRANPPPATLSPPAPRRQTAEPATAPAERSEPVPLRIPASQWRNGWATNVAAALMWLVTIAVAGVAIVRDAGGHGASRARVVVESATPVAGPAFPALPAPDEHRPIPTPARP
ncbi:MAG TPA: hypothetical protein VKV26_24485 [Dehalococcoidia bacterium]|nr:hypothetical protein [Dehalococcoidia bacterium]